MTLDPDFTELDEDQSYTYSPDAYSNRVSAEYLDGDSGDWLTRTWVYDGSKPPDVSTTTTYGRHRIGQTAAQIVPLFVSESAGSGPTWVRAGRWGVVMPRPYDATPEIFVYESGASSGHAYNTTFGFDAEDDQPDDGTYLPRPAFFHSFGSGVMVAYRYTTPDPENPFDPAISVGVSVTSDPASDAWTRIPLTIYPRDLYEEGSADNPGGPGRMEVRGISENQDTISILIYVVPYLYYSSGSPNYLARLEYDKASQTWSNRRVPSEKGLSLEAEVGIGERWFYASSGQWFLSDTGDIDGTYSVLSAPPETIEDSYVLPPPWLPLPSGNWFATGFDYKTKTDEWGNEYEFYPYRFAIFSTDWSEWFLLDDPLSGEEWSDSYEVATDPNYRWPILTASGDVAVPVHFFKYVRVPADSWWTPLDVEYVLLKSSDSAGGWD